MAKTKNVKDISKDERIGFHKGALDTLLKEKAELVRLVTIVDQLLQLHLKALKDLGVNIEQKETKSKKAKPIDDILRT